MADYKFYTDTYLGGSIPEAEAPRMLARASQQLAQYKRIYAVTAPADDSEDMAVCTMADAMYYFETAQNEPQSSSIGSVSSSQGTRVDVSPKAQAAEIYRCAELYLDIYRGRY
jgi:hypothetical protein